MTQLVKLGAAVTALWQTRLANLASQTSNGFGTAFRFFSQPTQFLRVQRALLVVLCLWMGLSLWAALWSFFPEAPPLAPASVINPVASDDARQASATVDIEALVLVRLFGQPGTPVSLDTLAGSTGRSPAMSEAEASVALAGIEDGAPQTRLPLILRGVLAASEAGLGQAVIEHRKLQDLYQVGDELPVSGKVVLAKVLPNLVVLDNGGRYELLRLFEDGELAFTAADSRGVPSLDSTVRATEDSSEARRRVAAPAAAADIAAAYRDRLYRDPQSLAEVVRVEAVRDGSDLKGYRIRPGNSAREFTALGFVSGDLVTAVNGMSLTDPANTVRLYQAMRSASEANFELQRKGESVTLNVNLGTSTTEGDS